jgi:hypothetical protein
MEVMLQELELTPSSMPLAKMGEGNRKTVLNFEEGAGW